MNYQSWENSERSMSVSGSEAEKKFWMTPELVESLLPFLDPPSILELAKAHPLTVGILEGASTWSRFVRRSCPIPPPNLHTAQIRSEEETERKVIELRPIVGILQLMGSQQYLLLELLDLICQRFAPRDFRGWGVLRDVEVMTCANHDVHYVSTLGFVLLEFVEGALGTLQQKVRSVLVIGDSIKGHLALALNSRMTRQERMIMEVYAPSFICKTQDEAEALRPLVQRTKRFKIRRLAILGAIGEDGWAALAEALRLLPPQALVVDRNLLLELRRETVRAVWDALTQGSSVFVNGVKTLHCAHCALTVQQRSFNKATEEDWVRLELCLDNEEVNGAENHEIEAQNENPEN